MKKKVCVITGTRAEYGLLKPVMKAIKASRHLELLLLVSSMHLAKEFGRSVDLIRYDGFKIDFSVSMNPEIDEASAMARSIGRGIIGMTQAFTQKRPDIILLLGDRIEALAAAIAGAYMNIPVAHIHGGDISKAGLDESARHAITKLAHIHFPATLKSRDRIVKMGENPKYVHLVGAPGLDSILKEPLLSRSRIKEEYGIDVDQPFIMVLQHPVTTQVDQAAKQIKETLSAVKKIGLPAYIIYPNSDAGGRAMIKEIKKACRSNSFRAFRNMPHQLYLSLLKYAAVLVGNSSSGIIESSSFKLPVVNIGIRQEGRERSTNVIDAPHQTKAIGRAIREALYDERFKGQMLKCRNPYGAGCASQKIIKVLNTIKLNKALLQKQITY